MGYHDHSEDSSLFAVICLDPRDPVRVARTSRAWLERGCGDLFGELERAVAAKDPDAEAWLIACATERDPVRAVRRSDQRWAAALDLIADNPVLVQVSLSAEEKRLSYAAVRLGVTRVVDNNPWVRLDVRAMLGTAFGPAVEYARWVDFLTALLDDADPAYGEICHNGGDDLVTELDQALRRDNRTSIRQSRQLLRGYSWVTVVPAELVDRLGGVEVIEATGAVAEVRRLAAGGLLLRATRTPEEYDDAAMDRLFRLVAPVLPPGLPRTLPGWPNDHRVVYEDASTLS